MPTTKTPKKTTTTTTSTKKAATDLPPLPGSCGISSVQQSRIIHGVDAKPGAWPWIISLQKFLQHQCGGTLLTPKWILTASHCVHNYTTRNKGFWSVKVGAHNIAKNEATAKRKSIKRVIMHPDYHRRSLKADIALIELNVPTQFNSRVSVACLPPRDVDPPIGKQCYLSGWGSIKHPGGWHHTLQQTRLPIVPSMECKKPDVVCVGNGFKNQPDGRQQPNACRGDSGGPLVCQQSDGRWQLEGVASYVYTYCKYYTAYTPVNKFMDWINSYIRN